MLNNEKSICISKEYLKSQIKTDNGNLNKKTFVNAHVIIT